MINREVRGQRDDHALSCWLSRNPPCLESLLLPVLNPPSSSLISPQSPDYYNSTFQLQDVGECVAHADPANTLLFKNKKQVMHYRDIFDAFLDGASVVINHLDKVSPTTGACP